MDVGRDGPGSEAYTRQAAAPFIAEFSTQSGSSPQVTDFLNKVLSRTRPLIENTANIHFGELLRVREQFEAFKLETAQKEMTRASEAQAVARQLEPQFTDFLDKVLSRARPLMINTANIHFGELLRVQGQFEAFKLETTQKEMTSSSEAQALARQFEDQGIELQKAQDEITRLTTELSTATERIERLGQEVAELPKARADLAAARVRITEEAALTDTAQAELAEIRTWQVEATTLLTKYEGVVELYRERNLRLVEREQAMVEDRDKHRERFLQLMACEDATERPRT